MPYGMLGAATIPQSQPPRHSEAGAPLPTAGREATKGTVTPVPKVAPLSVQIFTHSKTLAMACANFTIITPIGLTGAFHPAGYTPADRQTSWGVLHHPCTVPVHKLLFIRQ
jgi:hypothetical protein